MSARFHAGPPDAVNSSAAELTIAEQPPENRVVFLQRADRANGGLWRTAAPTHVLAIATVARDLPPPCPAYGTRRWARASMSASTTDS
jgi:hypothetical protein